MDIKNLIQKAFDARLSAYAPYSHFFVGAALLAKDGRTFTGCNIENSAYSPSNCAERTAFFKAVSEGVREFDRIVIVGGAEDTKDGEFDFTPPCGVCRQVMAEFCDYDNFKIILAKSIDDYKTYSLREILPLSFDKGNLNK